MPTPARRAPEHNLQVKVLRYLRENAAPDIHWLAIPNAGRRTMRSGASLKAEGMTAGAPDLCVLLPGGFVLWLELKTAKGVLSDAQKGFRARCLRLEHPYQLAHSFNEAIDILAHWGAVSERQPV